MVSKKELIRRHKPLTRKQVIEKFKEVKKMKQEMTTDAAVLEQNLQKFNQITDPLIDPETDMVLCWVRRPCSEEMESLIPSELLEYRGNPDAVPPELMRKHADFQFKMMAKIIDNPKKPWKWWKANTNSVFQQLFQIHLRSVLEDLGITAENF